MTLSISSSANGPDAYEFAFTNRTEAVALIDKVSDFIEATGRPICLADIRPIIESGGWTMEEFGKTIRDYMARKAGRCCSEWENCPCGGYTCTLHGHKPGRWGHD